MYGHSFSLVVHFHVLKPPVFIDRIDYFCTRFSQFYVKGPRYFDMHLPNGVFRDSFLCLSRWELDAAAITCHPFHAIIDEQMTGVCLRRLEKAGINRDTIFLLRDERARFTLNRIELSRPEELGPYLRSTSVGLLSVSFDEPLKSKSFGAVMDGLLDSAPTMVVEKMRFDDGAFSRVDFARITHLCRTFMSLGQLVFDGYVLRGFLLTAEEAKCILHVESYFR